MEHFNTNRSILPALKTPPCLDKTCFETRDGSWIYVGDRTRGASSLAVRFKRVSSIRVLLPSRLQFPSSVSSIRVLLPCPLQSASSTFLLSRLYCLVACGSFYVSFFYPSRKRDGLWVKWPEKEKTDNQRKRKLMTRERENWCFTHVLVRSSLQTLIQRNRSKSNGVTLIEE